jgi:membrane dipeptidase
MADPKELHHDALVIDSHNDTIVSHIRRRNRSLSEASGSRRHNGTIAYLRGPLTPPSSDIDIQINFPKMKKGGIDAAFFAVDVTRAWKNHLTYALDAFGFFHMEVADAENVVIAKSAKDITSAKTQNKIAAILSVENSDGTEGSLNVLHMLHHLGVRAMGLTHNISSWAADGNDETRSKGGLTTYGISLIKEMNHLGMLVDVSHISEPGFWDVIDTTTKPIIASHSNAKAVCDHPRNLTDDQIKAIAQNGGSIGVTFVPSFIDDTDPTFEKLIDHIDHIAQLVGPDHIGIGSDFDGGGTLVKDATEFPSFTETLLDRNYNQTDVSKILGENHLRVLTGALGG